MMTAYKTKPVRVQVISHEPSDEWPVGIEPDVPIFKGTCHKCGEDFNKHGVKFSMIFCPDDVIVKYKNKILAVDPDIFNIFFMEDKT